MNTATGGASRLPDEREPNPPDCQHNATATNTIEKEKSKNTTHHKEVQCNDSEPHYTTIYNTLSNPYPLPYHHIVPHPLVSSGKVIPLDSLIAELPTLPIHCRPKPSDAPFAPDRYLLYNHKEGDEVETGYMSDFGKVIELCKRSFRLRIYHFLHVLPPSHTTAEKLISKQIEYTNCQQVFTQVVTDPYFHLSPRWKATLYSQLFRNMIPTLPIYQMLFDMGNMPQNIKNQTWTTVMDTHPTYTKLVRLNLNEQHSIRDRRPKIYSSTNGEQFCILHHIISFHGNIPPNVLPSHTHNLLLLLHRAHDARQAADPTNILPTDSYHNILISVVQEYLHKVTQTKFPILKVGEDKIQETLVFNDVKKKAWETPTCLIPTIATKVYRWLLNQRITQKQAYIAAAYSCIAAGIPTTNQKIKMETVWSTIDNGNMTGTRDFTEWSIQQDYCPDMNKILSNLKTVQLLQAFSNHPFVPEILHKTKPMHENQDFSSMIPGPIQFGFLKHPLLDISVPQVPMDCVTPDPTASKQKSVESQPVIITMDLPEGTDHTKMDKRVHIRTIATSLIIPATESEDDKLKRIVVTKDRWLPLQQCNELDMSPPNLDRLIPTAPYAGTQALGSKQAKATPTEEMTSVINNFTKREEIQTKLGKIQKLTAELATTVTNQTLAKSFYRRVLSKEHLKFLRDTHMPPVESISIDELDVLIARTTNGAEKYNSTKDTEVVTKSGIPSLIPEIYNKYPCTPSPHILQSMMRPPQPLPTIIQLVPDTQEGEESSEDSSDEEEEEIVEQEQQTEQTQQVPTPDENRNMQLLTPMGSIDLHPSTENAPTAGTIPASTPDTISLPSSQEDISGTTPTEVDSSNEPTTTPRIGLINRLPRPINLFLPEAQLQRQDAMARQGTTLEQPRSHQNNQPQLNTRTQNVVVNTQIRPPVIILQREASTYVPYSPTAITTPRPTLQQTEPVATRTNTQERTPPQNARLTDEYWTRP